MQACALHNCSKALKLACSLAGPRDFLPLRTFTKAQRLRRWEHAFLSAPVSTYRPWKPATCPCDWLISRCKRFLSPPFANDGEQSLRRRRFARSYWLDFALCTLCTGNFKLQREKRKRFLSVHARSVYFRGSRSRVLEFRLDSCEFDSVRMIYGIRVDRLYVRTIERFSVISVEVGFTDSLPLILQWFQYPFNSINIIHCDINFTRDIQYSFNS